MCRARGRVRDGPSIAHLLSAVTCAAGRSIRSMRLARTAHLHRPFARRARKHHLSIPSDVQSSCSLEAHDDDESFSTLIEQAVEIMAMPIGPFVSRQGVRKAPIGRVWRSECRDRESRAAGVCVARTSVLALSFGRRPASSRSLRPIAYLHPGGWFRVLDPRRADLRNQTSSTFRTTADHLRGFTPALSIKTKPDLADAIAGRSGTGPVRGELAGRAVRDRPSARTYSSKRATESHSSRSGPRRHPARIANVCSWHSTSRIHCVHFATARA